MRLKTFLFKKTAIFVFLSAVSFIIFSAATFFNLTNFLAQAQSMPPLPVSNCQIEAEVQNITVAPPYSNAVNIPATANYLVTLKITKLLNTSCFPTLQTAQTIEATYSYLEFRKSSVRKGIIITGNLSSSGAKYVLSNVNSNTPPIPPVTPQNYTISLKKGWNMMSIPVNSKTSRENYYRPQSPPFYQYNYIPVLTNQFTIQDIKGCDIKEIWEYQTLNNKFIKPTYLNPLKGYWVLVENDCNGTISGYRYNQQATLYQGWNMFSSKYSWNEINIASPFSIQKSCIEKSKIFYFDTAQNKFLEISETSKLDDTKGYWIEVQKNCAINEFGFSNTQPPPLPPMPPNLPSIDIKANNSDGPISVKYNSTVTISWSSSNTTSCSITPGNWTGTSGAQTSAPLTANTTFTATCTSTAGTVSDSVVVNVSQPPPPPQNFTISLKKGWNMMSIPVNKNSPNIIESTPFTLNDIKNCSISAIWEYNPKTNDYFKPTYLNAVKGYWAYVDNDCTGSISGYRVPQGIIIPTEGWHMISSKYSWQELKSYSGIPPVSNNNTSSGAPPPLPVAAEPSIIKECLLNSKIYHWNTTENKYIEIPENQPLDDTKGYWVNVKSDCRLLEPTTTPPPPPSPPSIDIKANNSDGPISVNYNSTVTISWSSSNTTSCSITPGNWTGTSGTQTSAPLTANTTFTATCASTAGTVSDSVVVNVSQPPPVSNNPSISQLSPTSGDIDTKVTITGSGFTPTGNTVKFGSGNILNLNSTNNGTKIEFNVPANLNTCATLDFSLADSLPECGSGSPAVTPGVYPVSVKNSNGISNSLNFTVTANLGNALPFETLLKGATSISPERASYVVREPPEYEAMWFKHFGRVSRPFVDLGNKNIIAVFAGNKSTGGYGIEIKNVYYDKKNFKLNVIVKEYSPASSCAVSQSQSQPYHIILLDKNYAAVSFSVEQEVIKCN